MARVLRLLVRIRWLAIAVLLMSSTASGAETVPPEERIPLWSGEAPTGAGQHEQAQAWITVHKAAKPNGAAMVICPGGGYGMLMTGPEGHGIATWLNQHGIAGVVLEYRLPAGRAEVPLLDAQRALRTVRANAATWGIDAKRVGIIGFSAGGHLAATAGTHFDAGDAHAVDPIDRQGSRPDFMVLVYPVISMGAKTHAGSRTNLLGAEPKPELVASFSAEQQVTKATPPAYLAHAQDDALVPPANSQDLYDALLAHHIKAVYLKLPSGGHGLNGYQGPMWTAWQTGSLAWLAELAVIPKADAAER